MSTDAKTYTVRMRDRGQVTIPRAVRDKLKTGAGDVLTLLQLGDLMLLTPRQPRGPRLADQFAAEMEEAGVSLADLLSGLVEEREAINQERQNQDA